MAVMESIARVEGVTAADLDDEILLRGVDGCYYALDTVGAEAWRALVVPRSLSELTATITAAFEVDAEQAAADLRALLGDMKDNGLVTIGDEA